MATKIQYVKDMARPHTQISCQKWVSSYDELRTSFQLLDQDGDDHLDLNELTKLCIDLGIDTGRLVNLLQIFDIDGDGTLDFDEFCCIFYPSWEVIRPLMPAPRTNNPAPAQEEEDEQKEDGEYFLDTTFTADRELPEDAVWIRVPKLIWGKAKLFNHIEPNDISQGNLGDCWLLCALAGMAEFPGLIQSCFRETTLHPHGKYHIKIWDGTIWHAVVIDDYVPSERHCIRYKPANAQPAQGELWVLLLEKALAKWCGGYTNLEGGQDVAAWRMLMGRNDCEMLQYIPAERAWYRCAVEWCGPRSPQCRYRRTVKVDVFSQLLTWERSNYCLGAATFKADPVDLTDEVGFSAGEGIRRDGIVIGHAYTILQVVSFNGHNLIQLRNPWGDDHEWNGRFSDGACEWEEYPDLAEKLGLGLKDDGLFWMCAEDFANVFERVSMCPHDEPSPRRAQISPEVHARIQSGQAKKYTWCEILFAN